MFHVIRFDIFNYFVPLLDLNKESYIFFQNEKTKIPFDCAATSTGWEARGKTGFTGKSIEIVTSLFNACDTAIERNNSII